MNNYYRTSLMHDALLSLERCEEEVSRFRVDPLAFKWLVISLHSSVQGFMTSVLDQGNLLQTMNTNSEKKWLVAYENDDQSYPQTRMDNFLNLYAKIKSAESMVGVTDAKPFISQDHDPCMNWLNEQRNQFIHFNVSSYSVNITDVHMLFTRAMDIVEFCSSSVLFPWHRYENSSAYREKVLTITANIRAACIESFVINNGKEMN